MQYLSEENRTLRAELKQKCHCLTLLLDYAKDVVGREGEKKAKRQIREREMQVDNKMNHLDRCISNANKKVGILETEH